MSPRRTIYFSTHNHLQTSTHPIHQMSLASDTSILFHSSFNLLHMSLIKPHLHIHTTTTYPNNLPNPNITSLTSSFNSSQLPASHTSTTSSQISFNLKPNSPFSFFKHPQDFISILLFFYSLSYRLWPKSISISFSNSVKSKSAQKHTVSLCHMSKVEEDISPTGQIVSPNGGKTPYIGN